MESRFGKDFSRVRVHADAQAAKSAQEVNALAYTVGHDIVFGAGRYSPGTSSGQHLLAHELTHVVQQRAGLAPTGVIQRAPDNEIEVSQARADLLFHESGRRSKSRASPTFLNRNT
jgi:hypothetical protein